MVEILLIVVFFWLMSLVINPQPNPIPRVIASVLGGVSSEDAASKAAKAQLESKMRDAQANLENYSGS